MPQISHPSPYSPRATRAELANRMGGTPKGVGRPSARIALAALAIAGSLVAVAALAGELPDAKLTPGVTNPAVNEGNIHSTICVRGWTATIRPPLAYTARLKRQMLADPAYGYTDRDPTHYELDHLLSLENGGHPSDPRNLWPEFWTGAWGAHTKDRLENRIHAEICAGRLSLAEGQRMLATDWIGAYRRYFGEPQ